MRGKGRPIQKGQILNPKGRTKLPKEYKEILKLSRETLAKSIADIWTMDIEELRLLSLVTSGEMTGRVLIARVLYMAASKGDYSRMDAILNRAIGKPKEEVVVDLTGSIGVSKEVSEMTDNQLREVLRCAADVVKKMPEPK